MTIGDAIVHIFDAFLCIGVFGFLLALAFGRP